MSCADWFLAVLGFLLTLRVSISSARLFDDAAGIGSEPTRLRSTF